MSEILYDISNRTYLTGRSRSNGQNYEEAAHMQVSEDEEEKNSILRSIGDAYDSLKLKLSEYMDACSPCSKNILLNPDCDLMIGLRMPGNYDSSTLDSIKSAANAYIENMAIADWFNITNKDDAEEYLTRAAGNLEQIREAIHKRVRPVRTIPEIIDESDDE